MAWPLMKHRAQGNLEMAMKQELPRVEDNKCCRITQISRIHGIIPKDKQGRKYKRSL